jgi:hypothetical protein
MHHSTLMIHTMMMYTMMIHTMMMYTMMIQSTFGTVIHNAHWLLASSNICLLMVFGRTRMHMY